MNERKNFKNHVEVNKLIFAQQQLARQHVCKRSVECNVLLYIWHCNGNVICL